MPDETPADTPAELTVDQLRDFTEAFDTLVDTGYVCKLIATGRQRAIEIVQPFVDYDELLHILTVAADHDLGVGVYANSNAPVTLTAADRIKPVPLRVESVPE